jgi:hypothetical protein
VPNRERSPGERSAALRLGVSTETSHLQDALIAILRGLEIPLLWPALYALLSLALLVRDRSRPTAVALLTSGLLLELTILFVPAGSLWLASTALLGLLITRRRQ